MSLTLYWAPVLVSIVLQSILTMLLQMSTLGLREPTLLVQGHIAKKWKLSQNLTAVIPWAP